MKATLALAALFAFAALTPAATAAGGPSPGKGVKCGSSYIASGKTCTKAAAPAKAATAPAAKPTGAAAKPPAQAAKGVKCGNGYITAGKTCTKK